MTIDGEDHGRADKSRPIELAPGKHDIRCSQGAGLAEWRETRGLPADPMAAFAASGYLHKIADERVGGVQAGWGA